MPIPVTIPKVGENYLGDNPFPVKVAHAIVNASDMTALGSYPVFSWESGGKYAILDMKARVNTAFTASAAIALGIATDADRFMASDTIGATTAVVTGAMKTASDTNVAAGMLIITGGTDTNVEAELSGAIPTVGQLEVLMTYTKIVSPDD